MNPIAMSALLLLAIAAFAWSAVRRWRMLAVAAPEPCFELRDGEWLERLKDVLVYAIGQKRMPNYPIAGFAHVFIFAGFMVLSLRTLVLWGRGFDPAFDLFGILSTEHIVGRMYGLAKDVFAVLVLGGVLVFFWLRLVRREPRMTLSGEALLILAIIFTMMVADLVYDGGAIVRETRARGEAVAFHPWEPAGSIVAQVLSGVESGGVLRSLSLAGFWAHSALVLIFLNILPYSKHFHVITSLPNVFARTRTPAGALPAVEDLEGKVEREEPVGISRLEHLSWKHVLDLYTCTECGRCSDNCPAYTTGKILSPKHLTLALRDHAYASYLRLFGSTDGVSIEGNLCGCHEDDPGARKPLHSVPPAPQGGYWQAKEAVDLVPGVLDPKVIWACTTCRACEELCPVLISYVDKIVGMRRDQVMMKSAFPPELQKPFNGMETNGNPWNLSAMDRAAWAEGLDVPLASDKPDAELIYWVGCAASYDDRARKVARSMVKLLRAAGVDFAILGPEEACTGDPARRAGNEYLFQVLAQQNIETLKRYGGDKKPILTACPHCFNTLKNEYVALGVKFEVIHHSDFLLGLLARRKLVPTKSVNAKVAYHDSCYLGRYNDVYESPREILRAIPGVELIEVEHWTKNRGLCCGAGGAQMWMEEQNETRVNVKRTKQLLETGCSILATGCPFCMTMLTDGLKAEECEGEISQLDLAELLAASIDADGSPPIQAVAE